MASLKRIVYNKALLLAIDLEKTIQNASIDNQTKYDCISRMPVAIDKIFIYFNSIHKNKDCVMPFLIKCIYQSESDQQTIVMNIDEVYSRLKFIPAFYIDASPTSQYSYIDIDNNIAPMVDSIAIERCKKYEREYEEFLSMHSFKESIDNMIDDLENILYAYNIEYEIIRKPAIQIQIFKDSNNPICIALSNISAISCANIIIPEPNTNINSLGNFIRRNDRTITHARQEHLAIIVKCKQCGKNIIVDWMLFSNICPYCESKYVY